MRVSDEQATVLRESSIGDAATLAADLLEARAALASLTAIYAEMSADVARLREMATTATGYAFDGWEIWYIRDDGEPYWRVMADSDKTFAIERERFPTAEAARAALALVSV